MDITIEKSDDVKINIHGFNHEQLRKIPGKIESRGYVIWKKMNPSSSCQIVFFQD